MFKLTSKQANWQDMAGAAAILVDEATFEVTKEGLLFRAMDPSHIALLDVFWAKGEFDTYELEGGDTKFGVRVDELLKALKRRGDAKFKDELVTFTMGDDSKIKIKLPELEYSMRLIESSASSTPLPKLNHNSKMEMTRELFKRTIDDLMVIGEKMTIETTAKQYVSFTNDGDSGDGKVAGLDGVTVEVKEPSKATYSLDYLSKMVGAVVNTDRVRLEFSTKMPLKVSFGDGEGKQFRGRISYYLAPRVQD